MKHRLVEVMWKDITTYYDDDVPSRGSDLSRLLYTRTSYGWIIRKDGILSLGHKERSDRKDVYTNIPTTVIDRINKSKSKMEGIEIEGERTLPVEVVFWDKIDHNRLEKMVLESKKKLIGLSRRKAYAYGIIVREDDSTIILAYEFDKDECEFFPIPKKDIININKQ